MVKKKTEPKVDLRKLALKAANTGACLTELLEDSYQQREERQERISKLEDEVGLLKELVNTNAKSAPAVSWTSKFVTRRSSSGWRRATTTAVGCSRSPATCYCGRAGKEGRDEPMRLEMQGGIVRIILAVGMATGYFAEPG